MEYSGVKSEVRTHRMETYGSFTVLRFSIQTILILRTLFKNTIEGNN